MQTMAIRTVTNSLPENEVILLTLLISKRYIPYTDFTEKEWTYTEKGTGYTSEVAYVFHRDGTGGYRVHRVYDTGKEEHEARSFSWKFYTPNFKYICFDYSRYWELDYLNVSTLGVYEYYYDPVYYTGSGNGRTYHRFQYAPSPEE